MNLGVVIPAYNEAENLETTIHSIIRALEKNNIDHEILVVDDNSTDDTKKVLADLRFPSLRWITNEGPNGYGYAVRFGLNNVSGDCIAIMMADMSDSPDDLVNFYKVMQRDNCDCVFGTRWSKGGKVFDYSFKKKVMNRIANKVIQVAFGIRYNDVTNAFKMYKKTTIEGLRPFLSPHFNLTVELPLKAIIRGYSYSVVPNSWQNRKHGISKLKIHEMGSRYFFIMLYCLIEKYFSKGDFKKKW